MEGAAKVARLDRLPHQTRRSAPCQHNKGRLKKAATTAAAPLAAKTDGTKDSRSECWKEPKEERRFGGV